MSEWKARLKHITESRWWDSSLLVGLAVAIMIYTRFFGLSEPYIKAFDPYLFWRISENIWNTGVWAGPDPLRYYPFGWDSIELAPLLPHTLVYLGRIAGSLKAAVKFYPAMIGLLSVIAMALLGRRLGVSGLSSLILAIIPAYMFRTSQGFADKEPVAFFLGVLGWYFVVKSIQEKKLLPAIFGGISMGAVATAWGGKVLFTFALTPLFGILFLREQVQRVALLSISFIVYILMNTIVPRYAQIFVDPINMGLLGIAGFGIINYFVYQVPQFKKYKKQRIAISIGLGLLFAGIVSMLTFGGPTTIGSYLLRVFESPTKPIGTVTHSETVAENQRPQWTWNLPSNQFYNQFGVFFFLTIGVLLIPIVTKAWGLATKKGAEGQDYVYALALILAAGKLVIDFPKDTPVLLFLLGIPGLLEDKNLRGLVVNSIVAFSMYSAFSAIRLFTFTSVGIAIGSAYILSLLLKHKDTVVTLAGYTILIYSLWQIYPLTLGYTYGLGGTSLTTTWFENAKWMEFNVPHGEPVATWWDYGYWIQTLGNTTSLGDGGNVGPGYELNWNTGHFFATDDYENATKWVQEWNITYITIDAAMLPKYWAYSTLGGLSNVINQMRYQNQYPTEFGMAPIYTGSSDDYGPVAIAELSVDNTPAYLLGRIINGGISWVGVVDEFSYISNQGAIVCDPIGYCKGGDFGNFERLNQSIIVYPNQAIILGDKSSMHSTFARLWFFEGYNTDFKLLLNNGETKTFEYVGG